MNISPLLMNAQNSFEAKMTDRKLGSKITYTVKSDGENYRYDFIESGREGIVIVRPAEETTAILYPEKRLVHYTETSSATSRMNDPVQSIMTLKNRYKEKHLGKEEIAGYNCNKSELYAETEKLFTLWFSEQLNFPLRIENHLVTNNYMEVYDIKTQEIDTSIFIVPDDYTEVDDRMRPIIPEPPAPENWNTMDTNLPLKGEFKRGDIIRFKVPETKNYIVSLKNNSANPAKIIRKTLREGKELPDNEQGPIKYRTKRLFANVSSRDTYSWKAGDIKILEVHEGILSIEITDENK